LAEQPNLNKLDLHGCGLGDSLFLRLLPVLTSECLDLLDLDLSNNGLTDAIMGDLVLVVLQSDALRLQCLNLAGNKFKHDGLRSLATALQVNTFLEMLDVTEAGVDQRGLQSIFDSLSVPVDSPP
jgi:hypothetical protein